MPKWKKKILSKSSYCEVRLFTILLLYAPRLAITKKNIFFWKINGKRLFIQGVTKEFIVQSPAFLLPFLKDPADTLRPHSQISFKVGEIMSAKNWVFVF